MALNKFSFSIFGIVLVLVFGFAILVYNNRNTATAQEEPEFVCESKEMPVGAATAASLVVAKQLLQNMQAAISASLAQATLAERLLALSDDCKASNCLSGCNLRSDPILCGTACPTGQESPHSACSEGLCLPVAGCGSSVCTSDGDCGGGGSSENCTNSADDDGDGAVDCTDSDCSAVPACGGCSALTPPNCGDSPCWTDTSGNQCTGYCTQYTCEIIPCGGSPCPTGDINAITDEIAKYYEIIKGAKEANQKLSSETFIGLINGKNLWEYCSDQTKNRLKLKGVMVDESLKDLVLCLLEESRRGLSACITPAGVEDELEEAHQALTCQEAEYIGALSEKQQQNCFPGNFFCCYLK